MFDAIAKKYDFGPNAGQWNTGMQQFGRSSGQDGAQPIYSPVGRDGISPDLAKAIGYTSNGMNGIEDFNAFLQSKGLHLGQQMLPGAMANQQLFDANNNPVGNQYQANLEQDPGGLFAMGVLGAAGFGGAAALGAGAAAGGAGDAAFGGIDMTGGAAGNAIGDSTLASAGSFAPAGTVNMAADSPAWADLLTSPEGASTFGADAGAGLGEAGGGGVASQLGGYANDAASWMKANPGLVNVGGGLVNGLIGAYSNSQALKAQQDAAAASNAQWQPYRDFGITNGLNPAAKLLSNPSSITQDPGYQFSVQQGMQARDRSAASRGGLYSGAQLKAADRFGQDNANQYFDKILGRYTGAAQLGMTGTTNISNNQIGLGNAQAGAALSNGANFQNGLNSALGNYNWSSYTDALRGKP